jgi:hypothetical protein
VIALTIVAAGQADVIQPTVDLPPAMGAYDLGGVCVAQLGRCTQNAVVFGFDVLNRTMDNGNEVVQANATYSADIFTNDGGMPGSFLGHLTMAGTVEFVYFGRNPAVNPLGTFVTELTEFDFQGTLGGNTFEVRNNPAQHSTGSTTIVESGQLRPVTYAVSGSLDIFASYSFNGAPFMAAPPRTATLVAIPEPRSGSLAGLLVAAIAGIAARRRHLRIT